jgi:Lar family restriction alleviation protein
MTMKHGESSAESLDLKPCPFCARAAYFYENWVDFVKKWSVSCGDCGANLDVCEDTEAEAAAHWNKRASTCAVAIAAVLAGFIAWICITQPTCGPG